MTDPKLAAALAAQKRAERAYEARRTELFTAIGEAVTSGRVKQADAAKQLGFTREHIRRICYSYVEWREGRNPEWKVIRDRGEQRTA